ncbi:hypothetical protein lacNasYZ03_12020 [Lactobacillus nasalidis]|uniref:Uncharacterized protein n=1 Tax=Lactobacillus nasalidis TaxID=2797258 RepID=A0ABQ3W823_9LACO|nr:hypothetical protein lacNasYZ02_06130 [Lactobacillus nasalidis]GHW01515.1 hypothetical protein lacNasYZ03_12020 [Lactobacillus nasalidis]
MARNWLVKVPIRSALVLVLWLLEAADLELVWLEDDFAELDADLAADLELAWLDAFFALSAWLD